MNDAGRPSPVLIAQKMVSLAVSRKRKVAMAHMTHQTVTFSASPRELFNIYLDSKNTG
jgi:hypothetical protein